MQLESATGGGESKGKCMKKKMVNGKLPMVNDGKNHLPLTIHTSQLHKEKLTEFLLYKNPNGDVKIDVLLQNETIWLPQKKIAQLFDVKVPAISKHLKNIFESRELDEKVVVSILEIPTQHGAVEGKTQVNQTRFYNLDAIIAVGYRVNSMRATQFRIWATQVLNFFLQLFRTSFTGNYRSNSSRSNSIPRRSPKKIHGVNIVEKFSSGKNQKDRCSYCKKLSVRKGIKTA